VKNNDGKTSVEYISQLVMSGTEAEPLFSLLELMLRTFTANTGPEIKPGGHPEDIFVSLNDEEKKEIQCRLW
jgi:hypothetical protein